MSISFDGDLQLVNLDVQDLVGLSEEQIEDKISEAMPELSSSEVQTFMEELRTRLAEIEDELKDLQDGYEDDLDDSETTEGQTRYELKLEEVQEALDTIDDIDEAAEAALERETFLNQETDQDIYFAYDTGDLDQLEDGDVINRTALAGGQTGIFEDDSEEDAEAVDTNSDGFITYDEQIAVQDTSTAFTGQDIFCQINSGDKITGLSYSGNTLSCTLQTADGKTATLNFIGDAPIYFQGSDYMDPELIRSLPEDVQKRLFDNDDTMSMYDRLNDTEISDEDRLGYIDGYDDVVSSTTLDAVWASTYSEMNAHNTDNGTIKSAATALPYYQDAVNQLYGWIDDSSPTKDSISTVWAGIIQSWTTAGLSNFDISTLICNIVMGVALKADQHAFQVMFAPVITTLEGYFESSATGDEKKNTLEKMVITLLETQCGVTGLYGGADIWNYAFAHDDGTGTIVEGKFTDDAENEAMLEVYTNFLAQTGWAVQSGSETTATENTDTQLESEVEEVAPDGKSSNATVNVSESLYSKFLNNSAEYAKRFDSIDITEKNFEEALDGLAKQLRDLGECDAATMRQTILDYVNSDAMKHDPWKDNFMVGFMTLLHDMDHGLFWDLSRDSTFRAEVWKVIDNGGSTPDGYEYLQGWWNNAESYEDDYHIES